MRATYVTAIIIAIVFLLWLWSGQWGEGDDLPPGSLAEQNAQLAAQAEDKPPTKVRAKVIQARPYTQTLVVRGRTENKRTVDVRAEVGGKIVARPIERGTTVDEGDLLCRVAVDDREAGVIEAREALNQARIEYQGALKLKAQGFQSQTAIAGAKARLASAQANLQRRQLALQKTQVRAPFAGVIEDTALEVGDFVNPGGTCATVVDLDPMLLVGEVAERDVTRVVVGDTARAQLVNGGEVAGVITFVGQQSNKQTRTYPIEVELDNADHALRSGITAEIKIPVAEVLAHQVSPALLALDDLGNIGIRTLDQNDRVEFHNVDILDDTPGGVWLTGLPGRTTLITVGQELVVPGEKVIVEYEASAEMPAKAVPEQDESNSTAGGDASAHVKPLQVVGAS